MLFNHPWRICRKTLWITALLEEMRSASADESFWMTEPGRAWYPPRSVLVSPSVLTTVLVWCAGVPFLLDEVEL